VACSRFLAISPWRLQGARHVAARARCGPVASARLWLARRPRVWAGRRAWQARRGHVREGTPRSETYNGFPAKLGASVWLDLVSLPSPGHIARDGLAFEQVAACSVYSTRCHGTGPPCDRRTRRGRAKKSTPHPKRVSRSDFYNF
jgi:hypothetical protein